MDFSTVESALTQGKGEVKLRGWIKRKRDISGNIFFLLRENNQAIQCVADKTKMSEEQWDEIKKAHIESSLEVTGKLEKDERAPGGVELKVSASSIIAFGEEFPIQKDLSEDYLLSVRHLWLRSTKLGNALKVKATIFKAFRTFMDQEGYLEVHCPAFVSGAVEGGATLFEVPYFGKKVYLTQSSQFYLEAFATAFNKVYTILPSFRAEKSRTRRHLTEFQHAEWETAFQSMDELMDFEEKMIKFIVQKVIDTNKAELEFFGRDVKELENVVNSKFKRMTYDDVMKLAQKKFKDLKWGADLGEKEEREITKDFKVPVLVHHYPREQKPFYHRVDSENPKTVLGVDMLAPEGYGEIIGSGERTWKLENIIKQLKEDGINPEEQGWYVDLRKYGSVPHSGGGIGLERMQTWLCKLDHIRDVIAFPRTMNRFYP